MANRIKNDKGFLVIEMTPDEAINVCNFGVYDNTDKHTYLICDICNKLLNFEEQVYYIAVLNYLVDKDCYNDWVSRAKRYTEDISYEEHLFNMYATKLALI